MIRAACQRTHEDDRRGVRVGIAAQALERLEAVAAGAGHAPIQQNSHGMLALCDGERLITVGSAEHVPFVRALENDLDQPQNIGLVVDDEDLSKFTGCNWHFASSVSFVS